MVLRPCNTEPWSDLSLLGSNVKKGVWRFLSSMAEESPEFMNDSCDWREGVFYLRVYKAELPSDSESLGSTRNAIASFLESFEAT